MRPVLFALVAFLLLAGCTGHPAAAPNTGNGSLHGQGEPGAAPGPTPMVASVELGENGPSPVPAPNSMYLKATGMDALVVGTPVNLTVKNAGADTHDLVIDGLGVASGDIAPGASKTLTFTPTKDGTFDMYCDKGFPDPTGQGVATHRGAGMAGKVTVKKA